MSGWPFEFTEYNCGCVPDLDHFCRDAKQRVEQIEDASYELTTVAQFPEINPNIKRIKRLQKKEYCARHWLARHYRETLSQWVTFEDPLDEDGKDPRALEL